MTKPTALTIACLTLSFSILPVIAADTQPANDDPALTEAEEICRALAKNSDDKVLLKKLNSVMLKVKDDEQRARFVASFGLGALLVGASKEAAAARDYLDKNHPTSPYRQKLSADSLNDKCTKCNGTGVQKTNCRACNGSGKCPTCHGRGYVQVQKIGGGTRRGKCACGGSGKCKACGGTGKVSRTCTACRGKGSAFSREKARAVYVALLREKEIEELGETQPQQDGAPHVTAASTQERVRQYAEECNRHVKQNAQDVGPTFRQTEEAWHRADWVDKKTRSLIEQSNWAEINDFLVYLERERANPARKVDTRDGRFLPSCFEVAQDQLKQAIAEAEEKKTREKEEQAAEAAAKNDLQTADAMYRKLKGESGKPVMINQVLTSPEKYVGQVVESYAWLASFPDEGRAYFFADAMQNTMFELLLPGELHGKLNSIATRGQEHTRFRIRYRTFEQPPDPNSLRILVGVLLDVEAAY